ncbi:hypothetical protein HK097_001970 [Rhizophlyctis rosea]|uniref:Uncharacterized protein n=1 Tax=Rhizophlyctis rosea TaxID=64517 RepID=A0AAD5S3W7_9FUNG|nr:hypothetical protein HK097_001970 [Rhizophlyctis rosea]
MENQLPTPTTAYKIAYPSPSKSTFPTSTSLHTSVVTNQKPIPLRPASPQTTRKVTMATYANHLPVHRALF